MSFVMQIVEKTPLSIRFSIKSREDLIQDVLKEAEKFFRDNHIYEPSSAILVLKELLTNAVIHGNKRDPSGTIFCRIVEKKKEEFLLEVEDQGEGFNYLDLNLKLPEDPRNLKKRGYILINELSRNISFLDHGRKVQVILSI